MTITILPTLVQPVDVNAQLKGGTSLTLLDVRTPAEFESEHIAGSYNVPLDMLDEHAAELHRVGDPIILVCRSGNRAQQAEQLLRGAGLDRVHILVDGIQGWSAAGLALNRGRQRWSLERQVRAIAGALVLTGAIGSLVAWQPLIYLCLFVGGGLFFAGVSDTCLMGSFLMRLPYNRAAHCDVRSVIDRITTVTA